LESEEREIPKFEKKSKDTNEKGGGEEDVENLLEQIE
jgi:hypothetical protein